MHEPEFNKYMPHKIRYHRVLGETIQNAASWKKIIIHLETIYDYYQFTLIKYLLEPIR